MQRTRTWAQRIRRIPGHVAPRRFRLYGVGEAKSGTVTLARKFDHYRAFHEWDARRMIPRSSALLRGALSTADARAELRRRSRRFNIEADCAHFLAPFVPHLVELYDDARFVLLVRDCFSWLDSRVEFSVRTELRLSRGGMFAKYGRYGEQPRPEERALHDAGLFPLAAYLRYWAELPELVMRAVPDDRLCVVRTEDLDTSNARLAALVGVDPSTIRTVHANHNEHRTGLLARVPREHVVALTEEHCAPLMTRFWGDDWRALAARLPHR